MLPLFFCMKGFFIVLMFNKADNRGRLFANVEFPITFGGAINSKLRRRGGVSPPANVEFPITFGGAINSKLRRRGGACSSRKR